MEIKNISCFKFELAQKTGELDSDEPTLYLIITESTSGSCQLHIGSAVHWQSINQSIKQWVSYLAVLKDNEVETLGTVKNEKFGLFTCLLTVVSVTLLERKK